MTTSYNYARLDGTIDNEPKEITTDKSTFTTFSVLTKIENSTDWHKVLVFDTNNIVYANGAELEKGTKVRVDGYISNRYREIKDDNGKVIAKVKETSIIANKVFVGI
ncbi:MAG: single-stranded DNA-binding protein [Bacteroidota bacterium]